ncbi:glycosyltransferase family 2 protein [Pontibacter ruber]|uniref:Glycosyltransferase family 2 protein n=1 Tax=Pontibacter ruber TaxID=1343895 RepID=A0ABW5CV40_9BACT|nr:glycosyltransferase family 2 protein [Pontibacter ruber]
MHGITAIIICKNESENIAAALETVLWADEVLVVDSYSTDDTLDIAARYPIKILQRVFDNYSRQRNWATEQAANNWVLMLDADERVTEELAHEIRKLLQATPAHQAYKIFRRNYFMGQQVRFSGWQNDGVVRLFDRTHCRYSDKNVHEELVVTGATGTLQHKILHYTYKNLPHYLDKWNKYSWLSAQDKAKKTKQVTLFHLAVKPWARFMRQYFLKLGILDGRVGFVIAYLAASSVFMRYLKIWRLQEENYKLD